MTLLCLRESIPGPKAKDTAYIWTDKIECDFEMYTDELCLSSAVKT